MPNDDLRQIEKGLGVTIHYLNEATSTNDLAAKLPLDQKTVIWAESQTRGRGQRGNSWKSAIGKNLTFSLSLFPGLTAENQFYISKIVSIALIESLSSFGLEAKIKWPNDIYIADKKISGVLIENDLQGAHIVRSIVGIGLNVNQQEFDDSLPNPTSMIIASGNEFNRTEVLKELLNRIFYWENRLTSGSWEEVDRKYQSHLFRNSGYFPFKESDGRIFLARIKQVNPSGELILQEQNGSTRGYYFKEIEFVLSPE